jgi:predicted DNA-binding transcriptional regulator AlpA
VSLTLADLANPEALAPTLSFEETYSSLGMGRSAAYAAVKAGEFPIPIIGGPGKWRCPTLAVLKLLGAS